MTKIADPVADEEKWETLNSGSIGVEWDFDKEGPLTGYFTGTRDIETQKVESGKAVALLFAPRDHPDEQVFVWQSSDLSLFTEEMPMVRVGDLVKITFLGRKNFTAADGRPRQLKQYKVQIKSA